MSTPGPSFDEFGNPLPERDAGETPAGLARWRLPDRWARRGVIGCVLVVAVPLAIGTIVVAVLIGAAAWELYSPGLLDEVAPVEQPVGTFTAAESDGRDVTVPLRTCDPGAPSGALVAEGRTEPGASPEAAVRVRAVDDPEVDGRTVRYQVRARNGGHTAVTVDARLVPAPADDGVDARVVRTHPGDGDDPDVRGELRCDATG